MNARSRRQVFFATAPRGLAPVLHAEARALGLARVEEQVGGVYFEGRARDAWRANLWFRTATRVLWRLDRFPAADADALYRGVSALEWERFIAPESTVAVTTRTRRSRLDHTLFIAQRTKDAIVDRLRAERGVRPDVDRDDPDAHIDVHLFRDRATVSLDTSGASLHKRGWRRFQGRAPLAETLAAGIVQLSGWDRRSPLVDPFTGSATLVIEGALIAGTIAPGLFRERFAFERFPSHDAGAWERLRDEARRHAALPPKLILRGIDIDTVAIAGARENIAAAGLDDRIEVVPGDAREIAWKRGWNGTIVTNPPYGERVGDEGALQPLYERFGSQLRERAGGYRLALLSGNERLTAALGIVPQATVDLENGALPCTLLTAEIP